MIRVLQVVPSLNLCGGVENYIMNYYRKIDKTKFSFDFAYHLDGEPNFISEVERNGSKVFKLPVFSIKSVKSISREIEMILINNKYDIIHCHQANAAFLYFKIAKKHGIKVRIIHSHQTEAADKFTHKIRNIPLLKLGVNRSTDYIACSKMAGDFLFGKKKYYVVNNAIDSSKFSFNQEYRKEIRSLYGVDDTTFLIGHIGRLCNQKNQAFFIDIAKQLISRGMDSFKIILVGSGENELLLKEAIVSNNLDDYFILAGATSESYKYYSAFDLFALPSLYEGLPVVGVEAQYSGIPFVASTNITTELNFSNQVRFISLDNLDGWVSAIADCYHLFMTHGVLRYDCDAVDYNIDSQCSVLESIYQKLANEKN